MKIWIENISDFIIDLTDIWKYINIDICLAINLCSFYIRVKS